MNDNGIRLQSSSIAHLGFSRAMREGALRDTRGPLVFRSGLLDKRWSCWISRARDTL